MHTKYVYLFNSHSRFLSLRSAHQRKFHVCLDAGKLLPSSCIRLVSQYLMPRHLPIRGRDTRALGVPGMVHVLHWRRPETPAEECPPWQRSLYEKWDDIAATIWAAPAASTGSDPRIKRKLSDDGNDSNKKLKS
jgi:hypothetical protein